MTIASKNNITTKSQIPTVFSTRKEREISFYIALSRKAVYLVLTNVLSFKAKREFGFHTKSDKPRSIPINSELEQILNNLPVRRRFVFDNGDGQPLYCPDYYTQNFAKILKRAGIKNGNLHTLRHTFVSRLVMAGVDLTTVKELAGHASISTTMRYAHLSPDHKARAVELLCSGAIPDTKRIHSDTDFVPPSRNSLGFNSGGRI